MDLINDKPDPVLLEDPLLLIFKIRSERSPADSRALLEYAIVLRQFGHAKEALAALERAKNLDSPDWADRVQQEIQVVERIIEAHR